MITAESAEATVEVIAAEAIAIEASTSTREWQ